MLCLASAHALVRLDYGKFVGDTIEKTVLEAFNWALISGGKVALTHPQALNPLSDVSSFSSALILMSTVSVPKNSG